MTTIAETQKMFANKVKDYNLGQCLFALDDCHKAMKCNPEDSAYHIKLWYEIDALRDRQAVLKGARRHRPALNDMEQELLTALNLMTGWVIQKLEPVMSGTGAPYEALVRDMKIASNAISNATGGNEE